MHEAVNHSASAQTRRRIAALLVVALLGACGGPDADAARSTAGTRLTIAVPLDGGPLHPYSGASDFLLGLVYDKLFEPSPYVDRPAPGLAESTEQLDSITWVVTLRDGVRWHDGRPFTAADVRFTYEYYRDGSPNRHTHHVSEVPRIERITEVDERRVRFECAYPCPLLGRVTLADLPILPHHVWSAVSEPRQYTDLPVGTGPYRLTEYRSGRFYRFEANAEHYRGRPLVAELIMPIIADQSAVFTALRTGEIDAAARDLPPELRETFASTPGIAVMNTAALSIVELRPNYRKAPFSDARFREGLSYAIDRQALVDRVLLGHGRPGTRGYPHPDSPWTDPTLLTPWNADSAETLFDRAGYADRDGDGVRELPNGVPLRFTILADGGEPAWIRTAEMLTAQLAVVGIAASVQVVERGVLSQRVSAGQYDLFVSRIGPHGVADPDQFVMSQRSGYLWSRDLAHPTMDPLFERWRTAATVEARRDALFALQREFNRQPTSIALYYPTESWAYRPTAFDDWVESPGFGIVHKWSLLPRDARVGAVVSRRD